MTISALPVADRFRNAGGEEGTEFQVRLERIQEDGNFLTGEFTRLQSEDIPTTVTDEGLVPTELQDGLGLGHCAAFVFHRPTRVIAVQINPLSVTNHSISGYLHAYQDAAQYHLNPVPVRDTWAQFNTSDPRKITIAIASPENLHAIEGDDDPVIDSFSKFGEALGGHVITVEVSVGRKRDERLPKDTIRTYIQRLLGMRAEFTADVRKLKVTSDQRNGVGEYQEINFLREFLQEKEELLLPSDNADQNYQLRSESVRRAINAHLPYLTEVFAQ